MRASALFRSVLSSAVFAAAFTTAAVIGPKPGAYIPTAAVAGHWSGPFLVVADQADEFIALGQGVSTRSLAYLGFDPNASRATPSNGYAPPYALRIYKGGGSPTYLGLAGGVNAPAGAQSLQGATRVQTSSLLASWLAGHGGAPALGGFQAAALPLLLAHGISDVATDMGDAQTLATATVPSLLDIPSFRGTTEDAYPKTAGVYTDAAVIVADARTAAGAAGVPKVNVLSHSQGGLDARIAAARYPELFNSIGMIASPNDGSGGALTMCRQINPSFWATVPTFVGELGIGQLSMDDFIHANYGNCDGPQDGLYDLRPSYVERTINKNFPDQPGVQYYNIAGQCGGHYCDSTDLWNHCIGNPGGDGGVCVDSVFYLQNTGKKRGLQTSLSPVFDNVQHEEMKSFYCPVTRILAALYPNQSVGNPWLGQGGRPCAQNGHGNNNPQPVQLQSFAQALPSAPVNGSFAYQTAVVGSADVNAPLAVTLNPEGANDMLAQLVYSSDTPPTITVNDMSGNPDPNVQVNVDTSQGTGIETMLLTGLNGVAHQLSLSAPSQLGISVATAVDSTVSMSVDAQPATGMPGQATITASLSGLTPAELAAASVVASFLDASGNTVKVPLTYDASGGSFTATVAVPTGSFVPIYAGASFGATSRTAETGVQVTDNSGSLGQLAGDTLIDANGDGILDTLRLQVPVTVATADTYHLVVTLTTPAGPVTPGLVDASLPAGSSVVNVDIALAQLLAAGVNGPYEVTDARLSQGDGYSLVATAPDLGRTAPYDLTTLTPATTQLSKFSSSNVDTNGDGQYDTLRFAGAISTPAPGDYDLTATFEGPDGAALQPISHAVTLHAGYNPVTVDIDGHLISANGSGTYTLANLTLLPADPADATATISDAPTGNLDASQWVGAPLSNAAATVSLSGNDASVLPVGGAAFAFTGPGLPALTDAPPAAGSFAELDTNPNGTATCPASEPAGVVCTAGTLTGLVAGAGYTVTEVRAPVGYTAASPQTFSTAQDGSAVTIAFSNTDSIPPASATVSLSLSDGSTAGMAMFAVSGPGLPALPSGAPAPGSFAEIDSAPTAPATCPAVEPTGVTCISGILAGLQPGASYTVTEVSAPTGYAPGAPQTFTAPSDTATARVAFVNLPQTTPAITWATPPAISYGTALSLAQLNAAASVPGTFAYTPAAGAVLGAGPQTLYVAFTPTDTASYTTATATIALQVNAAAPQLAWATPAPITYGTALSSTQLDATAPVPGTFTYTPGSGTVLGAGLQTVSVTFTPTDSTNYTPVTGTITLQVNPASPIVTWPAPTPITYGVPLSATQLTAVASVPGTFAYTPTSGSVLAAGSQTLSVTFSPTDGTDYAPVTSTVTLQVNKAAPLLGWATPAKITYGTPLTATQLNATASVRGTFAYTPAAGAVLGAGSHTLTVTFTPTDTVDYDPVSSTVTLQVGAATPVLTWPAPTPITYGAALSGTQLDATASVPGTFTYTPAAGSVMGAGSPTLSVTFVPTDAIDYLPLTATVGLVVNKAPAALSWVTPATINYGTALSATQLNATATVPGAFVYTPASGTILGAGAPTLSVTFTPTDATDYSGATATVTMQVNKATPALNWTTPAPIAYGTALSATQLNATASVPGTLTYAPAAGTVLGAGPRALNVAFTPTDTANYTSASATVALQVTKATPTLTWATPATILYGTGLTSTQLNAHSSTAGTFTYTPAAGAVLQPGTQTLAAVFTPADSADYSSASINTQLTVGFSQSCITTTRTGPFTVAAGQSVCLGSGGKLTGPVTVAGSGTLWVSGGTITGPLAVSATGQLWVTGGTITGPLTSTGATALTMCATQVTGPITVTGTKGAVLIGGTGCAGNTITGAVNITGNTGGVGFSGNKVTGPLTIKNNSGGFQYAGNTVTGPTTVTGNS